MTNPLLSKPAEQIRDMWQSRALTMATGKLRAVLTVVLAKEYAAAFPILWRVTFGQQDVPRPFISGYATVVESGRLVADVTGDDGKQVPTAIYRRKEDFTSAMRLLADILKLTDKDRAEMFSVLQRWVVADKRVGPHGERLAS